MLDFPITAAIGVLMGVGFVPRPRTWLAAVILAPIVAALVLYVGSTALFVLHSDSPDRWINAVIAAREVYCLALLYGLSAAATCLITQLCLLRSGSRDMGILKAFVIILAATGICGGGGCMVGYFLGKYHPAYYRYVFRGGSDPTFDPVAIGIGQGLTQGLTVGVVVGCVVVLAVALRKPRAASPILREEVGQHFGAQRRQNAGSGTPFIQEDSARFQPPAHGK